MNSKMRISIFKNSRYKIPENSLQFTCPFRRIPSVRSSYLSGSVIKSKRHGAMAPAIAPSQWDFPIDGHRRKIKTLSLHCFTLTSKSKQLSKQCKLIRYFQTARVCLHTACVHFRVAVACCVCCCEIFFA